jgi:hypothetical protein
MTKLGKAVAITKQAVCIGAPKQSEQEANLALILKITWAITGRGLYE